MKKILFITMLLLLLGSACLLSAKEEFAGKVNGEKIKQTDYSAALWGHYEAFVTSQGRKPDNDEWKAIYNKTWEDITKSIVLDQAYRKYQISVTEKEVIDSLETNVPALIRNHPLFLEDGIFQKDRYLKSLRESKPVDLSWLQGAYYQYYVPQQKLKRKLVDTMVLDEKQLRDEFAVQNATARVMIFSFKYKDYTPIISMTDIVQYYREHSTDFARQPQADLGYSFFPVAPSKEDSMAVKTKIDSLYYRLQMGDSFAFLATKHSVSATSVKDGDMGYVELDSIPAVYRKPISGLKIGQYTAPIFNKGEWYLYRLTDKTNTMVRLSEIALSPVISDQTREKALDQIVRVRELAAKMGLAKASKELSVSYGEAKGVSMQNPNKEGILFESTIIERAIAAKPGYLFEPTYRQDLDGYLLIQVLKAQPHTQLPLDVVQDSIRAIIALNKQKQMAKQDADAFYAKYHDEKPDYIRGSGISRLDIDYMGIGSRTVPEGSRSVADALLRMQKSQSMMMPLETPKAYVVGYCDVYRAPDWKNYEFRKDEIAKKIRDSRLESNFQQWMTKQMKDAKVSIWAKFQSLNNQTPQTEPQNLK